MPIPSNARVAGSGVGEAVIQSLSEPHAKEVPVSASLVNVSFEFPTPLVVEIAIATKGLGSLTVMKLPIGRPRAISVSETNVIVATPATLVRVTMSLGSTELGSKNTAVSALANVKPGHETVSEASRFPSAMGVVTPAEQGVVAAIAVPVSINDETSTAIEMTFIKVLLQVSFIVFGQFALHSCLGYWTHRRAS
jgi:hypothetical protein